MYTKEEKLFDPLIEYLLNQDYEILEQHRGHERGADIIASKNGKKLYMELKGDAGNSTVDFGTALYQLMKYMNNDYGEYAIGISEQYVTNARRCEYAIKKLGIRIFVISSSGVSVLF